VEQSDDPTLTFLCVLGCATLWSKKLAVLATSGGCHCRKNVADITGAGDVNNDI
jgi:hypothetical protein